MDSLVLWVFVPCSLGWRKHVVVAPAQCCGFLFGLWPWSQLQHYTNIHQLSWSSERCRAPGTDTWRCRRCPETRVPGQWICRWLPALPSCIYSILSSVTQPKAKSPMKWRSATFIIWHTGDVLLPISCCSTLKLHNNIGISGPQWWWKFFFVQ